MQLGTRWTSGSEPPASVPAALRASITEVERHSPSGTWTLTWLEGRPIAELDTGWEVFASASGEVVARPFEE